MDRCDRVICLPCTDSEAGMPIRCRQIFPAESALADLARQIAANEPRKKLPQACWARRST